MISSIFYSHKHVSLLLDEHSGESGMEIRRNSGHVLLVMWGCPKIGSTPIAGWCMMEHPFKIDDEQGYTHFRKPPYGNPMCAFLFVNL